MISVGSRDARKGPGLGFGGGGNSPRRRDMDDSELEEREAYSYHNNNNNNSNNDDDDASIDPDIALSYIDEKLQDVLGHFQKDFEGGVSAENLGAKFGGYGSFLPTYQRSPAWSQRTPPKVQSYGTSRSPNNLHQEAGHCNSVVSSTAPQSGGRGPASTSSTSLPAVKTSSINESGKQVISMPDNRVEELQPRLDSKNKKHSNVSDQKTLKVRIKVGSGNLSTRKNAAIYSGLGLDDSPSSSMDDSPSESEGISHECQDVPFESPTSILQIMTSFPIHGGLLLSPLQDDLINLLEKEKLPKEGRCVPFPRGGMEMPSFINGSDTLKSDGKVLGGKNMKSAEKNDHSAESNSGNDKDAQRQDFSRKETDIDASACDELVSNTLKLPILSNSYSTTSDLKRSKEFKKGVLKDNVSSDRGEEKQMDLAFTQEDGWVEKQKASTVGKILVEGKESYTVNEVAVYSNREGQQKGKKTHESVKPDSNGSKAKKVLNTEGMDSSKQKNNKKLISREQENTRLPLGKEYPVPEEKKKSKGSHSTLVAEILNDSLKVCSSTGKTKKTATENCMTTAEAENVNSYKDFGRTMDTYKDFFGEMEEEDNAMDLLEAPVDKLKESDVRGKSRSVVNAVAKERPNAEKIVKLSTEAVLLAPSSSRSGTGTLPDLAQPTQTMLIKDDWVGCDKCQKWRLLPLGTNPDDLPEKWLCSMLTWLPGMNRCTFTEEETNNALIALYQAPPVPHSQTNLHSNPGGPSAGPTFPNFRHPDENPRNVSGKKKNGVKLMSNALKDGSIQSSKALKKNVQASSKSRSLNDVNNFLLVNEVDLLQLGKSNDLAGENQKQKYKEKNKGLELHGFPGDSNNSKVKSRKDSDHDSSRASKKIKTEAKNITDEGWASDLSGAVGKMGPSSSGVFPTSSAGKDRPKCSDRSFSKDSKSDVKDMLQDSMSKRKVKDEVSLDNGSLDAGNTETRGTLKKRKTKEVQNGTYPNTGGHLSNNMAFVKEEFSDNDYKKEKKPRLSRSEGKESIASKGHVRTDKKRSHTKTQQLTQDIGITQQNLDGLNSSKRDLGSRHASLAATSSSSKVSSSHKTKSSFQEVKGSPVESVSSSPMRISNPDKFTSGGWNVTVKDDLQHAGNFAKRSPKRSSDGGDMGGSNHTRVGGTDNTSNVAHRVSVEYPAQEFPHMSSSKGKIYIAPSPDATNQHPKSGALSFSGQDGLYPGRQLGSDHFAYEEKRSECHNDTTDSHPRKSCKGSSSKLDKSRSFKSDSDVVRVKSSDTGELHDHTPPGEVKTGDGKKKLLEKLGAKSDETEEKDSGRKDVTGKQLSDTCKRESQLNGKWPDGGDIKVDATGQKDAMSAPKQNLLPEINDERSSKRLFSDKTDQVEAVSSWERSALLQPSGGPQSGMSNRPHSGTVSRKGIGAETSQVDALDGDNAQKVQKQFRKADNQRSQHTNSRHPTKSEQKARDFEVPSPIRRDVPSHAATNALREAKNLKHMADRLKSAGSSHEGTGLYFQAALKFLHGASLLETGSSEGANHSDMIRSRQTYSETAKLCEFCAREYEKSKDLAAAALAYKCTEVAYMRVVYSLHTSASRDRLEVLQVLPPGESPSSSASDVDNLNNHTTVDKVALSKGVGSPQVAANHVIAAQNRPNFMRLLNFAQDVNFAMEASRKSWVAFSGAYGNKTEAKHGEAISSVKRVLDFSFHNIDGLLPLVRVAMEVIGR